MNLNKLSVDQLISDIEQLTIDMTQCIDDPHLALSYAKDLQMYVDTLTDRLETVCED